jgi:hypothetical protein
MASKSYFVAAGVRAANRDEMFSSLGNARQTTLSESKKKR